MIAISSGSTPHQEITIATTGIDESQSHVAGIKQAANVSHTIRRGLVWVTSKIESMGRIWTRLNADAASIGAIRNAMMR